MKNARCCSAFSCCERYKIGLLGYTVPDIVYWSFRFSKKQKQRCILEFVNADDEKERKKGFSPDASPEGK